MSGGVDSSLTAALLVEQGHDVTGVYMKNWTQDLPGMKCPWADDLADAKRVAVQLGIDFKVYDFENEYRHKVVDYMINEYRSGRTPNPDIMCNQEVKFKLFLEAALEDGADMIATGHYAQVQDGILKMATDTGPDVFLISRYGSSAAKNVISSRCLHKAKGARNGRSAWFIYGGKKRLSGYLFCWQGWYS
jgi:tRNA-specific 2-thiouridylase